MRGWKSIGGGGANNGDGVNGGSGANGGGFYVALSGEPRYHFDTRRFVSEKKKKRKRK